MPRRKRAGPTAVIAAGRAENIDKVDDIWSVSGGEIVHGMPLHVTAPTATAAREDKPAESRRAVTSQQHPGRDTSLNHLLSFSLPPRQHPAPRTSRRSTSTRHHASGAWGRQTRERYLNAQYRFMLKPTGDYTVHFADPDIYFNWPDVLQVIVPTSSILTPHTSGTEASALADSLHQSCPICLSEPVAARMTKCGHIFCYPCILHYLELADVGFKYRSCPICFDVVYARELKSVKWFDPVSATSCDDGHCAQVIPASDSSADNAASEVVQNILSPPGDEYERSAADKASSSITFRLIYRTTISTLAMPKSSSWPSELMPPHAAPWHFSPDALAFARFMLATPDYMASELRDDLAQLTREESNLRALARAAGPGTSSVDDLGLVFVEAAKRKVIEQIEKVQFLRTDAVERASHTAWLDFESLQSSESRRARRQERQAAQVAQTASSAEESDEYTSQWLATRQAEGGELRRDDHARSAAAHPASVSGTQMRITRQRRNVNPPAPPNDTTYYFYQAASGQHVYLHPLDIKILKSFYQSYSDFPRTISVKIGGTEEGSVNDELRRKCRYLAHLPEACDITFIEADLTDVVTPEALAPYSQALRKRVAKRRDKARKDDKARLKSEQAQAERERTQWESTIPLRARAAPPAVEVHEVDTSALASFPGLQSELSRIVSNGSDPVSHLQPSPATTVEPDIPAGTAGSRSDSRTVWGTRAIAAPANSMRSAHSRIHDEVDDDYGADMALERAWQEFQQDGRGGRRQGRKNKVVLNLSGGGKVSMRR